MGVGLRLKRILRDKNMTIKSLAEKTGVPINTLYSITKRDSEKVDDVILELIADVLDVPADSLRYDATITMDIDTLQQAIANLTATTDEKDWKRPYKTKEGVAYLPQEFNELDLFMESIGYRIIPLTPRNDKYCIVSLDGKEKTPLTVEELRELKRTSKASVKGLVESLMEKPSQNTPSPADLSET